MLQRRDPQSRNRSITRNIEQAREMAFREGFRTILFSELYAQTHSARARVGSTTRYQFCVRIS